MRVVRGERRGVLGGSWLKMLFRKAGDKSDHGVWAATAFANAEKLRAAEVAVAANFFGLGPGGRFWLLRKPSGRQ